MSTANSHQREAVRWVAVHILPHEPALRRWLHRIGASAHDIDDVVQQTYCRLSELESVGHITDPRAYFFTTARSFILQRVRKERVVSIQAASDQIDWSGVDEAPSPERAVGARSELNKVLAIMANLPAPYRRVIELRRIEGLSQKETAMRLGVTEKTVENGLARGLKALLRAYRSGDESLAPEHEVSGEKISNAGR
jgi:RNA polymerase sigma-70 factor (ECF subfamily)